MANKSTIIGRSYEKEIILQASNWINASYPIYNRQLHFSTTEGSGSKATTLYTSNSLGYEDDSSVDIRPVTDIGREFCSIFSVECKNYGTFNLDQTILKDSNIGASNILYTHWDKHLTTSKYHKKLPLLFYKNRSFRLKQFNSTIFIGLDVNKILEPYLQNNWTSIIKTPLVVSYNTSTFFELLTFKDFLNIKPNLLELTKK